MKSGLKTLAMWLILGIIFLKPKKDKDVVKQYLEQVKKKNNLY